MLYLEMSCKRCFIAGCLKILNQGLGNLKIRVHCRYDYLIRCHYESRFISDVRIIQTMEVMM